MTSQHQPPPALVAALAFLILCIPLRANAQEIGAFAGIVVPTYEWMGGGPYLGVTTTFPTGREHVRLRGSAGIGFVEDHIPLVPDGGFGPGKPIGVRARAQNAYDLGLSLIVTASGGFRPYGLVGVGYHYFRPWMEAEPFMYGAGFNAGFGVAFDAGGVELGLEVSYRTFGGYLGGTSGEKSYAPVGITIRW